MAIGNLNKSKETPQTATTALKHPRGPLFKKNEIPQQDLLPNVCSENKYTKRSSVLWLSYRFFEEFLFHIANLSCQKL